MASFTATKSVLADTDIFHTYYASCYRNRSVLFLSVNIACNKCK